MLDVWSQWGSCQHKESNIRVLLATRIASLVSAFFLLVLLLRPAVAFDPPRPAIVTIFCC